MFEAQQGIEYKVFKKEVFAKRGSLQKKVIC